MDRTRRRVGEPVDVATGPGDEPVEAHADEYSARPVALVTHLHRSNMWSRTSVEAVGPEATAPRSIAPFRASKRSAPPRRGSVSTRQLHRGEESAQVAGFLRPALGQQLTRAGVDKIVDKVHQPAGETLRPTVREPSLDPRPQLLIGVDAQRDGPDRIDPAPTEGGENIAARAETFQQARRAEAGGGSDFGQRPRLQPATLLEGARDPVQQRLPIIAPRPRSSGSKSRFTNLRVPRGGFEPPAYP